MKTYNEFIIEAKEKAPHDVPQHIWDLHLKHMNVEKDNSTSGQDSGVQKRRQTMSFRRLSKAIKDHVGDNDRKQLEYHWKLNDHYNERHSNVNESLQESLSTKEGVHKAGVERLTNAYIKHGVTKRRYSDQVTNSPRKYRVMMNHEDKIEAHINALPDVSKTRVNGRKESEEMLDKIRHEALTKATEHYVKKHGEDY
jgi:hypothetical protein